MLLTLPVDSVVYWYVSSELVPPTRIGAAQWSVPGDVEIYVGMCLHGLRGIPVTSATCPIKLAINGVLI
jgi:hypothetical protein